MKPALPAQFYLTGTDTDVGKTIVSALLCRALDLEYWKPVQSGLMIETDTELVARLARCTVHPETYRLNRPASPHTAAEADGLRIAMDRLVLPPVERLVVEGAGGLMVPYAVDPVFWQSDVIRHLALPVLVVARTGLGTLNHTFMTLRTLREEHLLPFGVIVVGNEHPDNQRDIAAMSGVPVLARVPWVTDVEQEFDALAQDLKRQLLGGKR